MYIFIYEIMWSSSDMWFIGNIMWSTCDIIRGIDVVRNKIKSFAHQKVTLPPGWHKIIILDELIG